MRRDYDLVVATPATSLVFGAALAAVRSAACCLARRAVDTEGYEDAADVRAAMYRAHERAALTIITDLRRVPVIEEDWRDCAATRLWNCRMHRLATRFRH